MDLFDEIAKAPEHRLAFFLERGDMLVINNYAVMHARTKFVEPRRAGAAAAPRPPLARRARTSATCPREVHLFGDERRAAAAGRSCTFDFKKLYGEDPRATGGMPDAQLGETELERGR